MRKNKVTGDWWLVTGEKLRRLVLKWLRLMIDAADEWVHTQEVKIRERAAGDGVQVPDLSVDRMASSIRERAHRRAAKAKLPRLRYVAGQFVRTVSV